MAPPFKLTYFDFTGLGEPIRYLLSYGGLEFEDVRIDFEKWPELKPKMPFGQLPLFEHNGKSSHQAVAICRYVAKQVKLVGKDDWEDLEIDAAVDTFNDMVLKICEYHYEKDEKIKADKEGPVFNEVFPFYMERLDAQAKRNNGYLACGQLTWADLFFVSHFDYCNLITKKKNFIDGYPNLLAVKNHVMELPQIKRWMETRPKTEY